MNGAEQKSRDVGATRALPGGGLIALVVCRWLAACGFLRLKTPQANNARTADLRLTPNRGPSSMALIWARRRWAHRTPAGSTTVSTIIECWSGRTGRKAATSGEACKMGSVSSTGRRQRSENGHAAVGNFSNAPGAGRDMTDLSRAKPSADGTSKALAAFGFALGANLAPPAYPPYCGHSKDSGDDAGSGTTTG